MGYGKGRVFRTDNVYWPRFRRVRECSQSFGWWWSTPGTSPPLSTSESGACPFSAGYWLSGPPAPVSGPYGTSGGAVDDIVSVYMKSLEQP